MTEGDIEVPAQIHLVAVKKEFRGKGIGKELTKKGLEHVKAIGRRKIKRLYSLSKEQVASKNSRSVEQEIVSLSAHNPQWIMLVTQTYSLMSIILFTSKFLL